MANDLDLRRCARLLGPAASVPELSPWQPSRSASSLLGGSLGDVGAGRPVSSWRWRQGLPASAATENPFGCGGASVSTARVACDASGLGRCDGCHRLLFKWPIIFWTPRDVQSPRPPTTALSKKLHSLPLSIRRIIQPSRLLKI